ncbi:MAG: TatD family nuclease-associated radical SAM protein [Candidatus Gastranaerophilales bacterium]|nr:TatD family nuclease-associated radical SAM protein [Candidatus Gastranaerophilales bacterium]
MEENNLVYTLDGTIYINLTNMCTNDCVFCIRAIKDDVVGANLFLKDEKITTAQVIEQLKKFEKEMSTEIVFCGYGEPTLKLDVLKEVAQYIKDNYKNVKIRINTNGQANLVYKRDIVPELKGLIDKVSISLNGENEAVYNELSQPKNKNSYEAVKNFIKECVESGIDTTATIVTGYKHYNVDVQKCEEITKSLGAKFRVREWLESGY